MLKRIAARKAVKIGADRDFVSVKSKQMLGQFEEDTEGKINRNQYLGFKCFHYSVTEVSKKVVVTVQKHAVGEELQFGIRTVEGTAKP